MSDEKEKRQNLKEIYEDSVIGVGNKVLKHIWQTKRNFIIAAGIGLFFVADIIIGLISEIILKSEGKVERLSLLYAIPIGLRHFLFVVILYGFLIYIVYRFCWLFFRNVTDFDEELNIEESAQKTKGSATKMKEKEVEENFESGNFQDIKKIIYGADTKNEEKLYALKENYGINHNTIIFGSPGAGKSRCYAIPAIMQSIREEHSIIVTDPKCDLYNKTAAMLRAHGYEVKLINLNPARLLHSDSVDIMGTIGESDILAQSFANTVLTNIYSDDMDFWGDSEMNLLTAAVLFIPNNKNGYEKNIKGVYDFLNKNTVQSLAQIIGTLPDTHPAKYPFNTYFNSDDTVKGNTLAGLQIHLSKLADKAVQKVLSTPDVDLAKPGKEKCAYFIGMSDQDHGLSWAVALIFTLVFQQLVMFADEQPDEHLPVTVELIMDEFYNIGRVPDFDSKISTVRSRGINTHVILQSLAQLQVMYPDNMWEGVMECFHSWMLLRTNSMTTAKYFSERSGQMTVRDAGEKYGESRGNIYHIHGSKLVSETNTDRYVYTPDEILRLNKNNLLVFLSGGNSFEMRKIDYSEHPMCKELRKVNAARHLPKWVTELNDIDYTLLNIDRIVEADGYDPNEEEISKGIVLCTNDDFAEKWNKKKEEELQARIKGGLSKEEVEEEYSHANDDIENFDIDNDPNLMREKRKAEEYNRKLKQYRVDQANGIVSNFVNQDNRYKNMGKGVNYAPPVREEKNRNAKKDACRNNTSLKNAKTNDSIQMETNRTNTGKSREAMQQAYPSRTLQHLFDED